MTKITKEILDFQRVLCETLAHALYEDKSSIRKREDICKQIEQLQQQLVMIDRNRERLPHVLKEAEERLKKMEHDYTIASNPKIQEIQRLQERIDALTKGNKE